MFRANLYIYNLKRIYGGKFRISKYFSFFECPCEASPDGKELIVFSIDDLIYRLIIEIHMSIIYRISRYRTILIYIFIYIENYLIAKNIPHINTI